MTNRLLRLAILLSFALTPLWLRVTGFPAFSSFYSAGFILSWVMLATIILWLVSGAPGLRSLLRDRLRLAYCIGLSLLVGWGFLSWSWAYIRPLQPQVVISAALPLLLVMLFSLVVACAAPSTRAVVTALVIGMVASSLIGGLQVAQQRSLGLRVLGEPRLNPAQSGVAVVQSGETRWLRPYGLLPHPNMLAGFLAVSTLAAWGLALSTRRFLRWAIVLAVFLLGFWCLLLTFSRAAWLGFAAGGLVWLALMLWHRVKEADEDDSPPSRQDRQEERRIEPQRHRGHRESKQRSFPFNLALSTLNFPLPSVGLVLLAMAAFAYLYLPFLAARAGVGSESIEQRSTADRAVYNQIALEAIRESPLLGVGLGNYPWYATYYLVNKTDFDLRGQPVHHIYLGAWAELGIVGLGLMLGITGLGLLNGLRALRQVQDRGETSLRAALLGGMVALLVIGWFDHYPWSQLQFQVLFFGLLPLLGRP